MQYRPKRNRSRISWTDTFLYVSHTFGATLNSCSNTAYVRKVQASGAHSDERQCYRKISIYVRRGTKWCKQVKETPPTTSPWHIALTSYIFQYRKEYIGPPRNVQESIITNWRLLSCVRHLSQPYDWTKTVNIQDTVMLLRTLSQSIFTICHATPYTKSVNIHDTVKLLRTLSQSIFTICQATPYTKSVNIHDTVKLLHTLSQSIFTILSSYSVH
jgi:hypothetical protein